jgi:predicted transglutaminase-like cysteine proteinase
MPASNQYKHNEYWAFGYETLNSKRGDCEDGAILLYDILRFNGIPAWKIRLTAGFVDEPSTGKKLGHAYVNYFCEENDFWIVLDWCYYPTQGEIKVRKDYKQEGLYHDVWFSFNEEYSWTKGLNGDAKEMLS